MAFDERRVEYYLGVALVRIFTSFRILWLKPLGIDSSVLSTLSKLSKFDQLIKVKRPVAFFVVRAS